MVGLRTDQQVQILYLCQDRADITFAVNEWCQRRKILEFRSDGVALVGRHFLEAYTKKQKVFARSSAEAELYAAALGASEAKGVQSVMCDLGFKVKPVLMIDAKATEHILHRHGIGKMKHIDVAHEVKSNRLRVHGSGARTILQTLGRRRSATTSLESMRYP